MAAVALEIVDGGVLDRVTISNLSIGGTMSPIFLRLGNRALPFKESMPKPSVGTMQNVIVSNIVVTGASKTGCSITGLPGHPIRNVTLSNIKLRCSGGGTAEDATRSIAELPTKYPDCGMFGTLPAYGFYCRHVDGLSLSNLDLAYDQAEERPALFCEDVQSLQVDTLQVHDATTSQPVVALQDVHTAIFGGCTAPSRTSVFLDIRGQSDQISLFGNDLSRAKWPFAIGEGIAPSVVFSSANRINPDWKRP